MTHTTNLNPASAGAVKSCFRCGAAFETSDRQRVCPDCRKHETRPRGCTRKELTFREQQIVDLVAQGKANKEIAYILLLTEGTIKEYLNRIFRKLQVSNRTELAIQVLTRRATAEDSPYESRPAFAPRSLVF